MPKNRIRSIVVHEPDGGGLHILGDRVSAFHAEIIERRLQQSTLSKKQKIAVIDKILAALNAREAGGMMK